MQARKKEMTQEEINLIKEIGQIRKAKTLPKEDSKNYREYPNLISLGLKGL